MLYSQPKDVKDRIYKVYSATIGFDGANHIVLYLTTYEIFFRRDEQPYQPLGL